MKFNLLSALVLALAVSATPLVAPGPSSESNNTLTARKYNQCYETTWEDSDLPFDRWPLISDCEELYRHHVEEKWWHVYIWEPFKTIAQHKSCAFGIGSPFDELGGKVGDDDVRDILRDAIRIKGRDGRVAA